MIPPVWLYGRIGEGRRKRILGMTLQANPISEFPDESGVLMVSGGILCSLRFTTL